MSWGGMDEVQIDDEFGYFYVHREGEGGGYWNRYGIEEEESFLSLIKSYSDDVNLSHIIEGEQMTEGEFQDFMETYKQNNSNDFDDWLWQY